MRVSCGKIRRGVPEFACEFDFLGFLGVCIGNAERLQVHVAIHTRQDGHSPFAQELYMGPRMISDSPRTFLATDRTLRAKARDA